MAMDNPHQSPTNDSKALNEWEHHLFVSAIDVKKTKGSHPEDPTRDGTEPQTLRMGCKSCTLQGKLSIT
jgi:hypothetical protein